MGVITRIGFRKDGTSIFSRRESLIRKINERHLSSMTEDTERILVLFQTGSSGDLWRGI